jgi:hypothetical protein
MRRGAIKGRALHCSTCRIHDFKLPSLPLIRVQGMLGAKLLYSFHSRDHGCWTTGRNQRLYAVLDNILLLRKAN